MLAPCQKGKLAVTMSSLTLVSTDNICRSCFHHLIISTARSRMVYQYQLQFFTQNWECMWRKNNEVKTISDWRNVINQFMGRWSVSAKWHFYLPRCDAVKYWVIFVSLMLNSVNFLSRKEKYSLSSQWRQHAEYQAQRFFLIIQIFLGDTPCSHAHRQPAEYFYGISYWSPKIILRYKICEILFFVIILRSLTRWKLKASGY